MSVSSLCIIASIVAPNKTFILYKVSQMVATALDLVEHVFSYSVLIFYVFSSSE